MFSFGCGLFYFDFTGFGKFGLLLLCFGSFSLFSGARTFSWSLGATVQMTNIYVFFVKIYLLVDLLIYLYNYIFILY